MKMMMATSKNPSSPRKRKAVDTEPVVEARAPAPSGSSPQDILSRAMADTFEVL